MYKKYEHPPFKTRKLAEKFITVNQIHPHGHFDRAFVKKNAAGYCIMYETFTPAMQRKVMGIQNMSASTKKVYTYHEIAKKPTAWIMKKYDELVKLTYPE